MACLKFCQLSIKIVSRARRRLLRHYHNLASSIDFHARDMHTRRSDGLHRSDDILLPKCGGGAGHASYREILLSAVIASLLAKCAVVASSTFIGISFTTTAHHGALRRTFL
jgi:hypothetical protein